MKSIIFLPVLFNRTLSHGDPLDHLLARQCRERVRSNRFGVSEVLIDHADSNAPTLSALFPAPCWLRTDLGLNRKRAYVARIWRQVGTNSLVLQGSEFIQLYRCVNQETAMRAINVDPMKRSAQSETLVHSSTAGARQKRCWLGKPMVTLSCMRLHR